MNEGWKPIPDLPGYLASTLGRIMSIRRSKPHIMSLCKKRNKGHDYLWVNVCGPGGKRSEKVHRLVLEAFYGRRPPNKYGRHLNDVKDDNRIENLEWGTMSENQCDKIRNAHLHGLPKNCKLQCFQVRDIRRLLAFGAKVKEIARWYAVSIRTIYAIQSGRTHAWLKG